ncbi:LolA family protein [Propionivibrio sp.]|uniref:LolA family protein n=1 Tax=Propionivibrio sp. TaxID=2212460 RepID=UPI00272E4685|nr:outer membrane lipoprotein carrier protein LolA [Propionivibrio sp.]
MKKIRSLLVGLMIATAALVSPLPARAADVLNQIGAQIEQFQVVRAEFVQTKQMAALKRPLVTSGHLTFSRQHGVLWQIEKPYRVSYVLGETKIVEIGGSGGDSVRRVRETRDVPGLAQVGRVFRAMLGANSDALREYFDVAAQGTPAQWSIALTPRQSQLARFLSGMELSGGRFVEEIRISEAGGDDTRIRLSNSQGAAALNDAEATLFGTENDGSGR